jgi:hypothetical protein
VVRLVVGIAIATVIGCGRLDFDERSVGQGDDDDASGDAGIVPSTCVSHGPEVCNGVDDDCNGLVDEGCACAPFAKGLDESSAPSGTVQTIWLGDALVQLVGNAATIGLWVSDASGNVVTYVPVYSGAVGSTSGDATMAWNGTSLAIALEHDTTVVDVGIYDRSGTQVVTTQIDSMYPGAIPNVTWAGDRFVVAWESASDVIARDISAAGVPLVPERVLATNVGGSLDAFQIGPSSTLVCIRDSNDGTARVISIDATGTAQTRTIPIGIGLGCELLPIAGGYLAWYRQPTTAPVPLAFLDASGAVTGTATLPDEGYDEVDIARIPSGFWVMASRLPMLYTHAVDELELDAHGNVTVAPTQQDIEAAYLWSPPRLVVTATRRISLWSTDLNGTPPTYKLQQSCN